MGAQDTFYKSSPQVQALVLRGLRHRFPLLWFSRQLKDAAAEHIESIRWMIGTIGLGLDADKDERFVMTQGGVLTDAVMHGYYARLPVREQDRDALAREIAVELYRHAGTDLMMLDSARLVVENGELVVVGRLSKKPPPDTGWVRAERLEP